MQKLLQNKKVLYGAAGAIVILVVGGFAAFKNGNGEHEIFSVERRNIVDEVILAGSVQADIVSDLGFEASGAVRSVFVKEGDAVTQGTVLAQLSLGTLLADLQSAQADVLIRRAELANTTTNLDTIRQKQDTLVANALSELLSDDLIAEPQSSTYTQTPPVITGRYSGGEGVYKLRVIGSAQQSKQFLAVFGLEQPEPVAISKTGTTPIGTRGLSVSFPDDISSYEDTTWLVVLPNEEGASYAVNYSAYLSAVDERNRAVEEAEADIRAQEAGSSIAEAQLAQAEASVARIQAQISERTLIAPFDGIVTSVSIDPGESVSTGSPAISLISQGGFGVEIDLPEVDSVKVRVGNKATITLDAFGENVVFGGTVVSVNRAETLVDNVAVYEARIAFDTTDERIASGMTAEARIVTEERKDVLAVPARAIKYREDGTPFVLVQQSDGSDPVEKELVLGLRGSDAMFEVRAGLSSGDQVLIAS